MTGDAAAEGRVIIGIDVGGTKTHAVAFDHELRLLAQERVPTDVGSGDGVVSTVIDILTTLLERLDGVAVESIGLGIPGIVDPSAGSVRQAVNLGIGSEPVAIAERLTQAFGARCCIENGVNVAALGAFHLLAQGDEHISDIAYLSVGTGIAAGIVLNGQLHRGHRGVAGEIGHFPVLPGGPMCECGLQGCLETVASGSAFARQWPATAEAGSAEALIASARAGDEAAIAILDPIADHLAQGVYLLAISFDVDRVVIGGGVADLGEPFLETIRAGLCRLESRSAFARSLDLPGRVMLKPHAAVGSVGAAVLSRAARST